MSKTPPQPSSKRISPIAPEETGTIGLTSTRLPGSTIDPTRPENPTGARPDVTSAENLAAQRPTPEHFLDLSLAYWQAGRYQDCIAASRKAIALRPRYAEAFNNISSAFHSMGQWDDAIAAARDAIRIAPNYPLAKNNLANSLAAKRRAESGNAG